jgi:hypothetical protein
MWARYTELWREGMRADRGIGEATEFYRQHREAMDAGAVIAWPERHHPDELSAIQHAINLRLDRGDAAFWSEYQNEPLPEEHADEDLLTADQIAAKVNGLRRGEVPIGCTHVTMFIDVQGSVRHSLFDTNYWKSFVHARLAVPMGDPGCLSLFGRTGRAGVAPANQQHRLLAEHLTSEYRVKTQGRGRTVDEWKLRVDGIDNHWLDCLVGCAVAASMAGATLFGTESKPVARPRVRLSALQGVRR